MTGSVSEVSHPQSAFANGRWIYALGFFLLGAVVGDLVGGGDWRPVKNRAPEIARVLATQQAAWNKGDLDGFMASYWKSEQLAFCGGAEMTYGWQATYDRYKRNYKSEGKEMGTLSFSELDVIQADDKSASARGKYHLQFRDGKSASGRFTLVLRRIDRDWKIVHDHTSADAKPSP